MAKDIFGDSSVTVWDVLPQGCAAGQSRERGIEMVGVEFAKILDVRDDLRELPDHFILFILIDTKMREFFKFGQHGVVDLHGAPFFERFFVIKYPDIIVKKRLK
jgi:hypothetical protein